MLRKVLLSAAVLVAAGSPLGANLVVPTEFREIVADATLIVRGTVTDVRVVRAAGRGLDSVATVAVDSVLKGEVDRFVSVRVPGGELGDRRFVMVGAPTFKVGQHTVLFLRRDAEGAWRPVGLGMGVYRVQAERGSGRPVVTPPVVGGWTAAVSGPVVRGDTRRVTVPVQDFESVVRLIVAGRALPRNVSRPERPVR